MRRVAGRDGAGSKRNHSEKQRDSSDGGRVHHSKAIKLVLQNLL
jgi:hypothetical protein